MVEEYRNGLDEVTASRRPRTSLGTDRQQVHRRLDEVPRRRLDRAVRTGVEARACCGISASASTTYPDGFTLHPQVQKIVDDRRKMAAGELPLDWGFAETLAYATLLDEGYDVRLTGQDSGRGTFFHRHAVLHDQETGATLHAAQAPEAPASRGSASPTRCCRKRPCSASSTATRRPTPNCLVIWEGQFGDFVNGAQVIIDQFISSGEAKWGRLCGLTLFLPHGYEGQGPEHSSARLERFLQLCAENNMQVCVPSTPAQMFHMLRRQMLRATSASRSS